MTELYDQTKSLDPTRPVNDASGYVHIKTDMYTIHDYDQDPLTFYKRYASLDPEHPETAYAYQEQRQNQSSGARDIFAPYKGEPYIIDEYGGTWWLPEYVNSKLNIRQRAYGKTSVQVEDLIEKLTQVLLNNPNICGFTYTQLTDVHQEVNGIYTFDRKVKFNNSRLKEIFGAPAEVEK